MTETNTILMKTSLSANNSGKQNFSSIRFVACIFLLCEDIQYPLNLKYSIKPPGKKNLRENAGNLVRKAVHISILLKMYPDTDIRGLRGDPQDESGHVLLQPGV